MRKIPKVILLINFIGEYNNGLLRGIAKYSNLHGPWAFYSELENVNVNLYLHELCDWGANGIIAQLRDKRTAQKIIAMKLPTVLANEDRPIPNLSYIEVNGAEIGTMAAEYLLNLGFSEFAYCGYKDAIWSLTRGRGFEERIKKAGFPVYVYERKYPSIISSWKSEQILLVNWLRSLPKPVGLMACNDYHARRVIEVCKVANLKIPEQIAVLGVDNDGLACNLSSPQLSSVALGAEKAGYQAAELLGKMMSGRKVPRQKIIVHPTHIITRPSTDTLAIKDREVIAAVRFIRKNASKLVQVRDVANSASLSRRSLEMRFKKILGRSVLNEIRYARANEVVRMLIETDMSVSQIAYTFGYTSSQNMTKSFTRVMGMAPLAYRKKYSPK